MCDRYYCCYWCFGDEHFHLASPSYCDYSALPLFDSLQTSVSLRACVKSLPCRGKRCWYRYRCRHCRNLGANQQQGRGDQIQPTYRTTDGLAGMPTDSPLQCFAEPLRRETMFGIAAFGGKTACAWAKSAKAYAAMVSHDSRIRWTMTWRGTERKMKRSGGPWRFWRTDRHAITTTLSHWIEKGGGGGGEKDRHAIDNHSVLAIFHTAFTTAWNESAAECKKSVSAMKMRREFALRAGKGGLLVFLTSPGSELWDGRDRLLSVKSQRKRQAAMKATYQAKLQSAKRVRMSTRTWPTQNTVSIILRMLKR